MSEVMSPLELVSRAVGAKIFDSLVLQRAEERFGLLASTREEVDVVVTTCCAPEDHAVRVESGSGNGSTPVLLEEAGVGFHPRKLMAIKIENFDGMGRRSTENTLAKK